MRTMERLEALKKYVYEAVCKGRLMNAPVNGTDIRQIVRQEPRVYLGWHPSRGDSTGFLDDAINVCPSILISLNTGYVKRVEEQRFDRYNHVSRPQELGQWLNVSILFSVYSPDIRLPGYIKEDGRIDMTKILEGTEEGLSVLMNWIDDLKDQLIADKFIPNSDLFLDEVNMTYSPYVDSGYIVDKRPFYFGFINCGFQCYAENIDNRAIDQYLV